MMANLSSDLQSFTIDNPITQQAQLNNTLHQFQTFPHFSSPLDPIFFHYHHHHQFQDHCPGKFSENNFQGLSFPSNIHNNDEFSPRVDIKRRKTSITFVSTSENSVSDQTLSTPAQVYTNRNILTKNRPTRRGKRSNVREEEKNREVVHVRAKRGQATDSHSLAERVRRQKINERLRCLKDIVPGCYKTMGMAMMLDEIINYVQSLQNQVQFLSMKLTAASSYYDFNSETDAVNSMQRAKAREAVELGQGSDERLVFHSSSWTL